MLLPFLVRATPDHRLHVTNDDVRWVLAPDRGVHDVHDDLYGDGSGHLADLAVPGGEGRVTPRWGNERVAPEAGNNAANVAPLRGSVVHETEVELEEEEHQQVHVGLEVPGKGDGCQHDDGQRIADGQAQQSHEVLVEGGAREVGDQHGQGSGQERVVGREDVALQEVSQDEAETDGNHVAADEAALLRVHEGLDEGGLRVVGGDPGGEELVPGVFHGGHDEFALRDCDSDLVLLDDLVRQVHDLLRHLKHGEDSHAHVCPHELARLALLVHGVGLRPLAERPVQLRELRVAVLLHAEDAVREGVDVLVGLLGVLPVRDLLEKVHARVVHCFQGRPQGRSLGLHFLEVLPGHEGVVRSVRHRHDLLHDEGDVVEAPDVVLERRREDAAVGARLPEVRDRVGAAPEHVEPALPPGRGPVAAHGPRHGLQLLDLAHDRHLVHLEVVALIDAFGLFCQHELHRARGDLLDLLCNRHGVALEIICHHLLEGDAVLAKGGDKGDQDGQGHAEGRRNVHGVRGLEASRAHEGHHVRDVP
mmetsp:Transcript_4034/g.11787  ORF Transcript_4034/g.11787 Transcript_4034/m.11787 type:complete len:533 (+) Transcript_4034:851-2449(+)